MVIFHSKPFNNQMVNSYIHYIHYIPVVLPLCFVKSHVFLGTTQLAPTAQSRGPIAGTVASELINTGDSLNHRIYKNLYIYTYIMYIYITICTNWQRRMLMINVYQHVSICNLKIVINKLKNWTECVLFYLSPPKVLGLFPNLTRITCLAWHHEVHETVTYFKRICWGIWNISNLR